MLSYMRQGVFETGARLAWLDEQHIAPRANAVLPKVNAAYQPGGRWSGSKAMCSASYGPAHKANQSRKSRYAMPLALFFVLLMQLWVRVNIISLGYELEALRASALKNDSELRRKRLELAYMTRPDLLRKRALSELGMVPLAPQRVRWLGKGKLE